MLKEIIDGKWLTAKGIVGIYPAEARGDDVAVWDPAEDESRAGPPAATFCMLRQQARRLLRAPFSRRLPSLPPAAAATAGGEGD